jgi:hypothetical protein
LDAPTVMTAQGKARTMLDTMPRTPKKKPASDAPVSDAKPQPQRTGKPINVWLPVPLHTALMAFLEAQRIKPLITDTVEVAIQEFLKREGFWPLPANK